MMKRFYLVLIVLFIGLESSSATTPKISTIEDLKKEYPQLVTADARLAPHPRILLSKKEQRAMFRSVKSNAFLRDVNERILSKSDKYLNVAVNSRKQIGRRLLAVSSATLQRLFYLSYAYRSTNDKRYAARAEQEMLAVCSFSDWNPSHFLDVAEMTMAVAIGYDWLYDVLSEQSRQIIREAIIEKGLKPSLNSKYTSWLKKSNNWNQVCNAGMTYGALAVFENEPELAAQIINRALETIKLPLDCYLPDGAYPEGPNYWEYGTSFHVMFVSAITKVFGTDYGVGSTDAFLRTGEYKLNMITPSGIHYNYADNPIVVEFSAPMVWFAAQNSDSRLIHTVKKLFKPKSEPRLLPATIVWGYNLDWDHTDSTSTLAYVAEGRVPLAAFRSSWSDENALYLGVKGGHSRAVSHQHMDLGSFVFHADKVAWAAELGKENYHRIESNGVRIWNIQRWDVFRYNGLNHNIITVNGKWQNDEDTAYMTHYSLDEENMWATIDLNKADKIWLKHHTRTAGLKDKSYAYIIDSITTPNYYTKIRWNMVSEATKFVPINDTVALLSKGDHELYMVVDAPKGVKIKLRTWSAQSENEYDSPNPGKIQVGFESVLPQNKKCVLRVYLVPRKLRNDLCVK